MFEHLELILTGFGIVLGVLAMLWGVTALIGFFFQVSSNKRTGSPAAKPAGAVAAKAAPGAAPSSPPALSGSPVAGDVPAHHLAVIGAAVSALIERPHRLVNVSARIPFGPHLPVWAQQGLFEHFASHRANLASWENSNGN